ncbi:MotA/TolQ/ExbB proton channel family protein [uncultured Ilyobacter sp.]|uniref:MotA/TolQ/ExbB proton channel family protein n=1 Tax=uncultured Ilyobacter sp. TaxID=544433 RepID=UPI0029F4E4B3|nr:MotA/TolQ/ExbB proton channel family protein [uncultured Ilyobacter sp.]
MEWIQNGGILMYFIVAMSVIGLSVVIEKIIYFASKEKGNFDDIKWNVKEYIEKGDYTGAFALLEKHDCSTYKVLKELLLQCTKNQDCNIVHMEEKAREVGLAQLPRLERGMWLLGIVAHTTPLLGLLGTVTGMIQAFHAIASYGTGDPSVLAEGISKALITTAGGLTVAIPAVIFYNYFNKRIDTVINNMEKSSVEMINFFRK